MVTKTKAALAFAGAIVVMAVLTELARQGADSASTSDTAVIESYTLIASRMGLMLGPYSRFQWHHPGPLYFYVMAPFYALSGFRTTGLGAGALALNLLSLAVIAAVVARRAAGVVTVATFGVLAVYLWRSSEMLASPWNPHVTVLPLIALVVTAAATVSGTASMLPVVATLASLVAQTHVALLPSALAIGFIAFGAAAISTRGVPSSGWYSRPASLTIGVLLVVWMPSIWQQMNGHPGNLTQLWTFFVVESHPGQSGATALSAWGDMMSGVVRPDFYVAHGWLFRESPVKWAEGLALVQCAALCVAGVQAFRARRRFDAALAGLLAIASVLALWSATRIEGAVFDHEVFWISGLGVLNTALLVALIAGTVGARLQWASVTPSLAAACGGVLVVVGATLGVQQLRAAVALSRAPGAESETTKAVASDLRAYLEGERISRPLVRIDQDAWGVAAGVIVQLQKAGVGTAVEDDWLPMFTPDFESDGKEAVTLMVAGKAEDVRLRDAPGDVVVVSHDPIFVHRLSHPSAVSVSEPSLSGMAAMAQQSAPMTKK